MELRSVGVVRCLEKFPFELPRQASLACKNKAVLEIERTNEMKQALDGVGSFSHIWVLYQFHKNKNWTPMVSPPRGGEKKKGVFATRAPYRPNPIGMSVVKLTRIKGFSLYIENHDFIDQSPILDLKPYLPYADSFPEACSGWLKPLDVFEVKFSSHVEEKVDWIERFPQLAIRSAIYHQLSTEPLSGPRKRVESLDGSYLLKYRTWRVQFDFVQEARRIEVLDVFSGYSLEELISEDDRYRDKKWHHLFREEFGPDKLPDE